MQSLYAPDSRVVIRDCEWGVRRTVPRDDGGYVHTVDDLSELVSGRNARFLTKLEKQTDTIRVLNPVETRFEQDLTPGFENNCLFTEAQARQITPCNEKNHLSHKAAIGPVPYQLGPVLQAHKQSRKRILVPILKSMMIQFQKEMWNCFTIPLTRLSFAGLQRVPDQVLLILEQLLTIYCFQFPVMRQNEAETWHDTNPETGGRIVFTPNKGLVGVGLSRKACPADLKGGTSYSINSTEPNQMHHRIPSVLSQIGQGRGLLGGLGGFSAVHGYE